VRGLMHSALVFAFHHYAREPFGSGVPQKNAAAHAQFFPVGLFRVAQPFDVLERDLFAHSYVHENLGKALDRTA